MPASSTTGGYLMGYPTTVDAGSTPYLGYVDGDPSVGQANAPGVNTALWCGVSLPQCILTGLRVQFTTGGNGNFDLGIYDVNGNLIANQGPVISATGLKTWTPANPISLSAGGYWLGLWVASASDIISGRVALLAGLDLSRSKTSVVTNLPATMAGAANNTLKPYITVLYQGGFS